MIVLRIEIMTVSKFLVKVPALEPFQPCLEDMPWLGTKKQGCVWEIYSFRKLLLLAAAFSITWNASQDLVRLKPFPSHRFSMLHSLPYLQTTMSSSQWWWYYYILSTYYILLLTHMMTSSHYELCFLRDQAKNTTYINHVVQYSSPLAFIKAHTIFGIFLHKYHVHIEDKSNVQYLC